MKFAVLAAGIALAAGASDVDDTAKEPRQLMGNRLYRQPNSNKYYELSDNDRKYLPSDDHEAALRLSSQEFYDDYNDIEYAQQESSYGQKSKIPSMTHSKNEPSSPAMSAVALLGFLYFLNLIQNVLQGRKKRSVDTNIQKEEESDGNVNNYLSTLETALNIFSLPSDDTLEGRSRSSMQERASGIVSFFSDMFNKIKSVFGFNREPISRSDVNSPVGQDEASPGLWSLLGKKVGMIATISDFLEDPSPTRLKRTFAKEHERDDIEEGADLAEERELNEEEIAFLPKKRKGKGTKLSRRKRYTDDEMNVWYDIDRSRGEEQIVIGPQQILGTIFNLLKKTIITSD